MNICTIEEYDELHAKFDKRTAKTKEVRLPITIVRKVLEDHKIMVSDYANLNINSNKPLFTLEDLKTIEQNISKTRADSKTAKINAQAMSQLLLDHCDLHTALTSNVKVMKDERQQEASLY